MISTERLLLEDAIVQGKRFIQERYPSFLGGGGRERIYFVYTETGRVYTMQLMVQLANSIRQTVTTETNFCDILLILDGAL